MSQSLRSSAYRLIDYGLRFIVYRIARRNHIYPKNQQVGISDSQATPYQRQLVQILIKEKKFEKFRRTFMYREIVESVSYMQGNQYIERIKNLSPNENKKFEHYKKNDSVGKPRRFNYRFVRCVSPTTLRYVAVACELRNLFGESLEGNLVEIGAGYGGQASILQDFFGIETYCVYDLPEAQELAKRYLARINKAEKLRICSLGRREETKWDLAISNYAFSELPSKLQIEYIEKVLKQSQRGYLIMNSGRTNHSGRSDGKLTLEELRNLLPEFEILEEIPNTGPDNYVIVWGHKRVVR